MKISLTPPVLLSIESNNVNTDKMSNTSNELQSIRNIPDYLLFKKPVSGYSSDDVVHLSDMKLENHKGKTCVRLYCAVVDEQTISDVKKVGDNARGQSNYKDVKISSEGNIVFSGGKQAGLWINVGRPVRAYEWHQKYKMQFPDKTPIVRSWCVELSVLKKALADSEALHLENHSCAMRGDTLNTDQLSAPNQFFFKGESLNAIIKKSIPETYKSLQGENVKELIKEVGLHKELKTINLFVTKRGGFQPHHAGIARALNTHYLTWFQAINNKKGSDVVDASIDSPMFYNKKLEGDEQKQNKVYQIRLDRLKKFLLEEGVISDKNQDLNHPDVKFFMENVVIENANLAQAKNLLKDDYLDMLNLSKNGEVI